MSKPKYWTVKQLKEVLEDLPDNATVRLFASEIAGKEGDWLHCGYAENCDFWLFAGQVKP